MLFVLNVIFSCLLYIMRYPKEDATVNIEIFTQYIFSRISRMALHARKYDVSEKMNQTSTEKTNSYMRENLVALNCSLRLYARKFSCAKISTFTVYNNMIYVNVGYKMEV